MANGAREALKTPFGNQPAQVADPVPGEDISAIFDALDSIDVDLQPDSEGEQGAQTAQPTMSQDMQATQAATRASAQEGTVFEGQVPQEVSVNPELVEQEPSFAETNLTIEGIKKQLDEALPRARLSFAVTDFSKEQEASKLFGKDNVRTRDGSLQFRPKPNAKWRKLDQDNIELIGDIADVSRDIVEMVVENAIRLGGTGAAFGAGAGLGAVAGAAKGATTAPITGPLGPAAGGAVGGVLGGLAGVATSAPAVGGTASATALSVGDTIAEEWLGIERDPQRSGVTEKALAASLGAGFEFFASKHARKVAVEAGRRKEIAQTIDTAKQKADDAIEAVTEVNNTFVREGNRIKLLPGQQTRGSGGIDVLPEFTAMEADLGTEAGYKNFIVKQGELIKQAYQGLTSAIAGTAGSKPIGNKIITEAVDLTKAEGKAIGWARDLAIRTTRGAKAVPENFNRTMGNMLSEMGLDIGGSTRFNFAVDKITAEDIQQSAMELNEDQAKRLATRLNLYIGMLKRNPDGLTLKQVDKLYTSLRETIDKMEPKNPLAGDPDVALRHKLITLKDGLRDDWTQAIGDNLGGVAKEEYLRANAKFSELRTGLTKLNKVLKQGEISREALAKKVFATGPDAVSNIKNLRKVIQQDSPDLYKQFIADYFNVLSEKHTKKGVFNFQAAKQEFKNLGEEFRNEMFTGIEITPKQAESMLEVGAIFQNTSKNFQPNNNQRMSIGQGIKNLYLMTIGRALPTTTADIGAKLIDRLGGKDKALAEYLAAGGIDDAVRLLPPEIRPRARNDLGQMVTRVLNKTQGVLLGPRETLLSEPVQAIPSMLERQAIRSSVPGAGVPLTNIGGSTPVQETE